MHRPSIGRFVAIGLLAAGVSPAAAPRAQAPAALMRNR